MAVLTKEQIQKIQKWKRALESEDAVDWLKNETKAAKDIQNL